MSHTSALVLKLPSCSLNFVARLKTPSHLVFVTMFALVSHLPLARGEEVGDKEQDAPRPAAEGRDEQLEDVGVPYEVTITGIEDGALVDLLEDSSSCSRSRIVHRRPFRGCGSVLRKTLTAFRKRLRSEGCYESTTIYRMDQDADPREVTLEVTTGPLYRLSAFQILYEVAAEPEPGDRPAPSELGVGPEMPARAPDIVAIQNQWQKLMAERGYPLAEVIDRKAVINRDTKRMDVTLRVDSGADRALWDGQRGGP